MVYIEKIIEKGYVYESNISVSVYFVLGKFDSSSNHYYGRKSQSVIFLRGGEVHEF